MAVIKVSDEILKELREMLQAQNESFATLRIVAHECSDGMAFQLFIDPATENDTMETHGDIKFVADNKLIEDYDGFTISAKEMYGETFLQVLADKQPTADCGGTSCSGCSSCSSCG